MKKERKEVLNIWNEWEKERIETRKQQTEANEGAPNKTVVSRNHNLKDKALRNEPEKITGLRIKDTKNRCQMSKAEKERERKKERKRTLEREKEDERKREKDWTGEKEKFERGVFLLWHYWRR